MKPLSFAVAIFAVTIAGYSPEGATTALAQQKDPNKTDLDQMQGTWRVVGLTIFGREVPADDVKTQGATLVIMGDTYKAGGTFKVKIDATKTPKAIDITILKNGAKGKTQQGIYKFEGQQLLICWPDDGKERPSNFDAKKNKNDMLLIYERDKK